MKSEKNGTRIFQIGRIFASIKNFFGPWLKRIKVRKLEKRHAKGYTKHPVEKGEFDLWENEQAWLE